MSSYALIQNRNFFGKKQDEKSKEENTEEKTEEKQEEPKELSMEELLKGTLSENYLRTQRYITYII